MYTIKIILLCGNVFCYLSVTLVDTLSLVNLVTDNTDNHIDRIVLCKTERVRRRQYSFRNYEELIDFVLTEDSLN